MDYENYAERIKPLYDFASFKKPKADMKSLIRISVKKGEMTTHKVTKTKFSQLNDERFYFLNAILSLPYGHTALKQYLKKAGTEDGELFYEKKRKLLELDRCALKKCSRLKILDGILSQSFKVIHKKDPHMYLYNPTNQSILDFVLDQEWMKDSAATPTTDNLMET